MKEIIVINGLPQSGKDSFINYVSLYAKVINYSTIDFVKGVATHAGWDGNKDGKGRRFLSELKRIMTEYDDIPYKITTKAVNQFKRDSKNEILFIHVREASEIERIVKDFKASSIIVRRPNPSIELSNVSDRFVEEYGHYTYLLNNDSTLDSLDKKAKSFVKYLRGINDE